ncbi:MAG: 23S rRNA (guanosine(2251)-2'-O)-methyltransferase RlmB [Clostridium sp. 26_21]|nr:MAG: 23S rRNA (guanosine(2251)-2'-O)-methyltransferase RlmB [Clostridium sp. 26_21]
MKERKNENRKITSNKGKFEKNNFNKKESNKNRMQKNEEHNQEEKRFDDQIEGRNSVLELLESGKDVNKIFVTRGEKHGSINKILGIAKERKIIVVEKDKKQMDEMAQEENYQGVIAIVPPFEYVEISDILQVAKERNEDPFVIVLDGIEDPHNLGSIIRTAETAGVHGVIIPKRRAASVNSTVNKASAGAVEHMKIARVTNISDAIEELKQAGLWVCGTAVDTNKYYYNQDLTGPLAIVIGNEGKGIGEKVKKNCDFLVKIPMKGKIQSLNASVSTGIVIYESVKQRIRKEN